MIARRQEVFIKEALERSPSVVLLGPRQVGKTTLAKDTAKTVPSVYLDLENRLDRQKVEDIESFYKENSDKLIILDEVQRLPEIFATIRGIIDDQRQKGNKTRLFLFLGSASMKLLKQSSETLAGRISIIELFAIDALEYAGDSLEKINTLWLRGGFPESVLAKSDQNSLSWRRDFIETYVERDIPQLGPRIPAETLDRFWTMLAHHQGSVVNFTNLSRSLDVSGATVARYLDLMTDLLLARRLRPWASNIGKRLVRSPKIYVRDSGLVHALLNIGDYNTLLGHPVVGGSWEGYVIENIFSVTPTWVQAFYYSTPGGAEIDLLLEFPGKEIWAIEIKRNSAPSVKRGFYSACEEIKPQKKYVVYPGKDRFSLGNGITAISLVELMKEIAKVI